MAYKPRVSIVTTSFNHADYIEENILSVKNQDYDNIEHLIIDGGSTDGTLEILKIYPHLKWISKKDEGQTDAANKGFRMASGKIIGWLNSDDYYEPNTISKVVEYFKKNPDCKWLCGYCKIVDINGKEIRKWITLYKNLLLDHYSYPLILTENFISAPTIFFKKEIFDEIGDMDVNLNYAMDYDYWCRIGSKYPLCVIKDYISNFRWHEATKSGANFVEQFREELAIAKKYGKKHKLSILVHHINYLKIISIYSLMKIIRNLFRR